MPRKKKALRGFAVMDFAKHQEISSLGGKAAHEKSVAHEWGSKTAKEAGRKGGKKTSENKAFMSEIGRRGGLKRQANARLAKKKK